MRHDTRPPGSVHPDATTITRRAYKYLDLSGYGFSGKTAVIELVREFRGYHVPARVFEFVLLRIQGGILDLEDALCNDWSPIRSAAAIRRFARVVRRLGVKTRFSDPRTWFDGTGWNYDPYFNGRFLALSHAYLSRLVSASWVKDWPYHRVDLCGLELFLRHVARLLGFRRAYDVRVVLSFPDEFVAITRDYLNAVLSSNVGVDVETIVLHNAFEPFHPQRALKFFDRAKCIIVDRDPRDTYVEQLSYEPMAVGPADFVLRHRTYRAAASKFFQEDRRVLRVRFEELVLDYDRTVALILSHLEEDRSIHVTPRRYFDPDVSKENIGLWRQYPKQEEIEIIYQELREYCDG